MKTLNKFILIVLVNALSIGIINAQCSSSFTYTDNGSGVYTLTSTSTGGDWHTWLVDNNYIAGTYQTSVNHTFPTGTFNVCLALLDSATGCTDTSCQIIIVSNGATCNVAANFSATDLGNGFVNFVDNSTGVPSSPYYDWSYGDGTYGSSSSHTYSTGGTYTVCLTVSDQLDSNCYDTYCSTVIVQGTQSNCNLSSSFTAVDNGNGNISFIDNSTGVPSSPYYDWSYGDGTYGSTASHTYSASGTYTVCLTVSDQLDSNCYDTYCTSVTVQVPQSNCNLSTSFTAVDNGNGNVSFIDNSAGVPASPYYDWSYGDGTYGSTASHIYSASGTYNVCLTVSDQLDSNCYDTYCASVTVQLTSSNCNISVNFTGVDNGNGNVSFTDNSTGVPANPHYDWSYGDGTYGSTASHTYSTSGTYNVCLTISDQLDSNCYDWYCTTVTVQGGCNLDANFSFVDNGSGNYTFTNASTGGATSFHWSFGDGNISASANVAHTFATNGTFPVTLTVGNSTCVDFETIVVHVTSVQNPVPCQAGFVVFPDSNQNNNVIVINTSTGNNLNYFWDFGDGNTSTLAYPNYTYGTGGPFNLCLTVSDGNGCSSTHCDSIGSGGVVLKQTPFSIDVQPNTATSVEEKVQMIGDYEFYPNPVKENLTIELNLLETAEVSLYLTDLLGKVVERIHIGELTVGYNQVQHKVTDIPNGIYLLNLKTQNSLIVEKLVLNR